MQVFSKRSFKKFFAFRLWHLLVGAVVLSVILCVIILNSRLPTAHISGEDVKQEQSIIIEVNPDDYLYISSLYIEISGTLDGVATIRDPWGRKRQIGPGDFAFTARGEYFSETANVDYKPENVVSGHVAIRYRFEEL